MYTHKTAFKRLLVFLYPTDHIFPALNLHSYCTCTCNNGYNITGVFVRTNGKTYNTCTLPEVESSFLGVRQDGAFVEQLNFSYFTLGTHAHEGYSSLSVLFVCPHSCASV